MKMNRFSRVVCLVVLTVMMFSMVLGCSSNNSASTANTASADVANAASTVESKPADDGKVYELKFSHHDPANGTKGTMFQKWADDINKASNGRLKITIYAGSTLGAAKDGLNMVSTGICDILWSYTGFFNKEFPATDVMSLPMVGFQTAEETVDVFWDLYETRPEIQKEFEGLKPLLLYGHPPAAVGSNELIAKVGDLKGVKLRVPTGPATDVIKEWGGAPVTIPTPDIFESVEKNVINGFTFDWAGIKAFKLNEAVDYFLDLKLYVGPMFMVINEDKWNELPADLQKIIEDNSGRTFSHAFCQSEDKVVDEFKAQLLADGKTITVPTEEANAEFKAGADAVIKQWIEAKKADGFDGQNLFDEVKKLMGKY